MWSCHRNLTISCFIFFSGPTLIHRHPHGSLALFAQSNYSYAILFCYVLAPILCMPTYFVFTIRQTRVYKDDAPVMLYHLDADENTSVYR